MLRFGKFDFKDYDSRSFIKLFIEDETIRSQVTKSYQYKETKRVAIRKLNQIVHSLRVVEDEDLKQELRFMLLKKAMKYKKKKRTVDFSGYLYGVYRYEVCNYIQRLLKPDELYVKRPAELMRIADDRLFDEDSNIEVEDSIFVKSPMIQMDEEIGNSWVRGITCGDEFKDLTPLQRMIIKLNYYDGYTDGKIADMMGIHINTIFRQRKKQGR
ncbi:hypothetical protein QO179_24300 [Bacillus stercoris]|nr:hypothetical protein [Bacillus stercoris]